MKKLWLSAVLSTLSVSAIADHGTYDLAGRFGIGAGLGFTSPLWGNNFDDASKGSLAYNLHGRYNLSSANSLQLNLSRLEFKEGLDLGANRNAKVYDVLFLHRCDALSRFSFVYGAGAGVADLSSIDPYDNLKLALKARAGAEYGITHDLFASVTVDYQYMNNMPGSDSDAPHLDAHALVPQANLTWYFGGAKEAAVVTAVAAAAAPVVAMDRDTDGDGVMDKKDKCPGTPAGSTVNAYGCVKEEKASIQVKVLFASGSAVVSPASNKEIEELATFLNEHKGTKAEIQGHTDSSGKAINNKKLSQFRADAVKNALINTHKIDAARLHAVGFGSEQPVADNKTAEGRLENRRVIAIITE